MAVHALGEKNVTPAVIFAQCLEQADSYLEAYVVVIDKNKQCLTAMSGSAQGATLAGALLTAQAVAAATLATARPQG